MNYDDIDITINCAFYEKCLLSKKDSICNKFPDFLICPEYNAKKDKLMNQNDLNDVVYISE